MAKLDYERDYYADLELPPTADVAEVKKQFKKLALKFHPDRNLGKEEEAKEKFHIIQAAHDILSDPIQKSKLDAYRLRSAATSARYSTASGVKGNPYQNVSADLASKYGTPPRATRPPMPPRPAATSASSRYAEWPHKAKSKMDNAWANMEAWNRAKPHARENQSSNGTASANQSAPRQSQSNRTQAPPPPPRTAAQARRQDAAFGTSRKTGFTPSSPATDEGPVRNRHYNTHTSAADAGASPTKSRPQSAYVDPQSARYSEPKFSDPIIDSRQRTPYVSHPGEKTDPFEGVNMNRAKSMRDEGRRFQNGTEESRQSPSRPRSASVGPENGRKPTGENNSPSDATKSPRFPYPSKAGEKYSPHTTTNSAPPTAGFATTGFAASFAAPSSSTESLSSNSNADGKASTEAKSRSNPTIFPVPDGPTPSPSRFARSSADNIYTQFSAGGTSDFQFSAGSQSADDSFMRAKQRSRSTPRDRQSPLRHEFAPTTEAPTATQAAQAEAAQKQGAFNPNDWKESIGPHIFAPAAGSTAATSPTRSGRVSKRPQRPVRMTAGTAGVVDSDDSSEEDRLRTGEMPPTQGAPRSPNAMDIDPPAPGPILPPTTGARNINVEPTKPEWRAGNASAQPNLANENTKPNATPSSGPKMAPPPINPNTAGSEDADAFSRSMFGEFRNVEPFVQKPAGLNSFADLGSNLPFESRPSASIPIAQEKPKQVNFPAPPPVPRPPSGLLIPGSKGSSSIWIKYVKEWETYLREWFVFNKKVTDHFVARQRLFEERAGMNGSHNGGLGWLNVQSDGPTNEYLRWLEEDKFVRRKWIAACDQHEAAFREFRHNRERMKQ